MTAQDVAALTAIITIIKQIGAWPLATTLIAVVAGPWIGLALLTRYSDKQRAADVAEAARQHAEVVQMYKDNVELVKNYNRTSEALQDIIVLSTQTMTQVRDRVDSNLFCPLMRKDQKVEKQP